MRFAFLALLSLAWPAFAGSLEGRVIEVVDGRTITVLAREGSSLHRIRLVGIQAPGKQGIAGSASRESLRRLLSGKNVRVEATELDAKGRLLGTVLVIRANNDCGGQPCAPLLDPGISQLATGHALIESNMLGRLSEETQKRYAVAQEQAKSSRTGIWRDPTLMLRADFRPE